MTPRTSKDILDEATRIACGTTMMLPTREHLVALHTLKNKLEREVAQLREQLDQSTSARRRYELVDRIEEIAAENDALRRAFGLGVDLHRALEGQKVEPTRIIIRMWDAERTLVCAIEEEAAMASIYAERAQLLGFRIEMEEIV